MIFIFIGDIAKHVGWSIDVPFGPLVQLQLALTPGCLVQVRWHDGKGASAWNSPWVFGVGSPLKIRRLIWDPLGGTVVVPCILAFLKGWIDMDKIHTHTFFAVLVLFVPFCALILMISPRRVQLDEVDSYLFFAHEVLFVLFDLCRNPKTSCTSRGYHVPRKLRLIHGVILGPWPERCRTRGILGLILSATSTACYWQWPIEILSFPTKYGKHFP